MQELERLYRHLVGTITATGPARWQDPLMLADMLALIPYRTGRKALGIDSSEEYELLILRLAGGEGGFMSTEPEAVGQRFANEAVSVNPDLGVLREFRDARLMFAPAPLMRVLSGSTGNEAYAPPAPPPSAFEPPPSPPSPPLRKPAPEPYAERAASAPTGPTRSVPPSPPSPPPLVDEPLAAHRCAYCDGGLPTARKVNFCPHCGQPQATGQCSRCKAEVEHGWKHCANCGAGLNWGTQ